MIKTRFEANFGLYDRMASIQREICGELCALLGGLMEREPACGYEIGAGTGFLTRLLMERYPRTDWVVNDLSPRAEEFISRFADPGRVAWLWGDAEKLWRDAGAAGSTSGEERGSGGAQAAGQDGVRQGGVFDLVASASTIQWFDDVPGFIGNCAQSLASGGVLALSTFGLENFIEIKRVNQQGLEYMGAQELRKVLKTSGLEILHLSEYTRKVWFGDPREVLHHIRATGVNSISRVRWTKRDFDAYSARYWELFGEDGQAGRQNGTDKQAGGPGGAERLDDGARRADQAADGPGGPGGRRVPLTYHPVLIVARKK